MSVVHFAELVERRALGQSFGLPMEPLPASYFPVKEQWSPREKLVSFLAAIVIGWTIVLLPIYGLIRLFWE